MSDIRPTLYVTNWSSRKLHGPYPGRKWTIMARPRKWEHGEGGILVLTPSPHDLTEGLMLRALSDRGSEREAASMRVYREAMEQRWEQAADLLRPGGLVALDGDGWRHLVGDRDSLLCACARSAECHRRWAVPFLRRAGWRVVLDGEEVTDE